MKEYQFIIAHIKAMKLSFLGVIFIILTSSLLNYIIPKKMSTLINIGVNESSLNSIGKSVLLLVGLYVISTFMDYLMDYIFIKISTEVGNRIKRSILSKLTRIDYLHADDYRKRLTTLFLNDTTLIQKFISRGIPLFLSNVFYVLVISFVLATFNLTMFFVGVFGFCFILIFEHYCNGNIIKYSKKSLESYDKEAEYLNTLTTNFESYLLFEGQSRFNELMLKKVKANLNNTAKIANYMNYITSIVSGANDLLVIIILGIGLINLKIGIMTIGQLTVYIFFVNTIAAPTRDIANFYTGFKQTGNSIKRISVLLEEDEVK